MADDQTPADRLELALSLHDAGVAIMRENLRRKMPSASDAEVDAALAAWLGDRPGAPDGDGDGVRRRWPRR